MSEDTSRQDFNERDFLVNVLINELDVFKENITKDELSLLSMDTLECLIRIDNIKEKLRQNSEEI